MNRSLPSIHLVLLAGVLLIGASFLSFSGPDEIEVTPPLVYMPLVLRRLGRRTSRLVGMC